MLIALDWWAEPLAECRLFHNFQEIECAARLSGRVRTFCNQVSTPRRVVTTRRRRQRSAIPYNSHVADSIELKVYPCGAPRAAIVVAHGAGGGQSTPFMVRAARGFADRGIAAATFDFPYMSAGRKVPDRAPALEGAWRQAIESGRRQFGSLPLFIGGKSMGGRMASHIAAQGGAGVLSGVIFFGYPLHPPNKPEQRRDAHLPQIAEPMLFVQGSRDPFGTGNEIRALLPLLRRATLHEIAGGDHSLKAPARQRNGDSVEEALDAAAAWIDGLIA